MKLHDVVVKRSIAIIIIWGLIAAISFPSILRIDAVTEYSIEKLIPKGFESERALSVVKEIAGKESVGKRSIIMVKNVDSRNIELIDVDEEIYRSIKGVILEYNSPYSVAKNMYRRVDEKLRVEVNDTYTDLEEMYSSLNTIGRVREGVLNKLYLLHNYTHMVKKYYETIVGNRERYDNLLNYIYTNLSQLCIYIVNVSTLYNNTVNELTDLNRTIWIVTDMVIAIDSFYSHLSKNLSNIYSLMVTLNNTFTSLNWVYYNGSSMYTRFLYDVIRIHYYLLYNTTAYETGINESVVQRVVEYTEASGNPVAPGFVNEVYSAVINAYDRGNISVEEIYSIATTLFNTFISNATTPDLSTLNTLFISVFNATLLSVSTDKLTKLNTSYFDILSTHPIDGQIALLNHLNESWSEATPIAVQVFSDRYSPLLVAQLGAPEDLTPIVKSAVIYIYRAGYPINYDVLRDLVVNTTLRTLMSRGLQAPVLAILYVLNRFYSEGALMEIVIDALQVFSNEAFGEVLSVVGEMVIQEVLRVDPIGGYLFVYNRTSALYVSSLIVANITGAPLEALLGLALGLHDVYTAAYIWLTDVLTDGGYITARIVLSAVHRHRGVISQTLFHNVFTQVSQQLLTNLTATWRLLGWGNRADVASVMVIDRFAELAWRGGFTRDYVYRALLAVPFIAIVTELSPTLNVVDQVVANIPLINFITTGYGYSEDVVVETLVYICNLTGATRDLAVMGVNVEKLLVEIVKLPFNASTIELIKALAGAVKASLTKVVPFLTVEDIADILNDILIKGLNPLYVIVDVATRYAPPLIDTKLLKGALIDSLQRNDPGPLYLALRNATFKRVFDETIVKLRGIMVSEDYTVFSIVITPIGESTRERAMNTLTALRVVKNVLASHGYKSAEVYVVSQDILEQEARSYLSRDIERINKVSLIATILIVIPIIGGLIASTLPLIGVALSIIASYGLIYILASLNIVTLTSWGRMLLVTTSLGLGMNYSSYIITRFREVYPLYRDPRIATYESLKFALPALMASSSTDIVGFAVLRLAWEIPLIASIGEAVPIAIAMVLAVSLTLTPALLVRFGDKRWFWWPRSLSSGMRGFTIEFTRKNVIPLLSIAIVLLSVCTFGFTTFRGSHDYRLFIPTDSSSYRAVEAFTKVLPAGGFMPIYATCSLKEGFNAFSEEVKSKLNVLRSSLLEVGGVAEVYGPMNPGLSPALHYVSSGGRALYIEIIIKPHPLSREGIDLTRVIKRVVKESMVNVCDEVYVGGVSASKAEVEDILSKVFWIRIFPTAIILMMVFMSISFMSIYVGPISILSITVGYLAGVSAVSLIANLYGQPMLWFLPLILLPAVLGVGMDYNSYYMNRHRYEVLRGAGGFEASTRAVNSVSTVILGLGLIVTVTYASLLIGSSWGVKMLGIGLSTSVLTVTLLASYVLTPSILALLGPKAWRIHYKRSYNARFKVSGSVDTHY